MEKPSVYAHCFASSAFPNRSPCHATFERDRLAGVGALRCPAVPAVPTTCPRPAHQIRGAVGPAGWPGLGPGVRASLHLHTRWREARLTSGNGVGFSRPCVAPIDPFGPSIGPIGARFGTRNPDRGARAPRGHFRGLTARAEHRLPGSPHSRTFRNRGEDTSSPTCRSSNQRVPCCLPSTATRLSSSARGSARDFGRPATPLRARTAPRPRAPRTSGSS